MPLSDVTVKIDLVKPSSLKGLGTPLILAKVDGNNTYKEYGSLEAIKADYPETTAAYKKAAAIFAQGDNAPSKVAIGTYGGGTKTPKKGATTQGTFSIRNAFDEYFDNDWHFLILADATADERLEVAKAMEEKSYKFVVLQVTDREEVASYKGKDRTIVFYHPLNDEHPDAGLVGSVASHMVGSVTWKFKNIVGITPQDIKADELKKLHTEGAIAYVTKAGHNETSEGITASGEYIDVLHGKDWVKLNIETSIQSAFSNNGKIPFSNAGFSLLSVQVTNVLQTAFANGIIAEDANGQPVYSISTKTRDQITDENRKNRVYDGLSFTFELAGAVHSAEITGEISI
ncbi:DUF3383 family protein [Bacillus licheniformis]|uniref:DUF3383 family protein n=1 Tax=Bacillus licheniformis TaxID=1402 RepID=UPI00404656B4